VAGVGIKEVAARAGVAIGTVSNVLNRRDLVAPETRQRVLDAIEELGYVRNESARALRAGKSRTIALVVLDAANPFFADVSNGVEPVVADIGSILVVCDTAGDLRRERRYLAQLEEQRVQGILITPVGGDDDALRRLSERGTPVVLVDSGAPRHGGCSVTVDDVLGGNLAVTHLLETGRRRIALVGGHAGIRQVDDRRKGAHEAIAESPHGDVEVVAFDTPVMSIAAGRGIAEEIAALPVTERPTGVFCANDLLALGLMVQLRELSVRIPDEMAVIGYDDIEFAGVAVPPLSSVRQPRAELGRTAAELLAAELDEGEAHHHRHVTFKPELIIRQSTAPAKAATRKR
jgi:DNA-binding LacI/PurR family transcriptional regulator